MLYISSACVKHEKIKDSVEELAQNGFLNIELSGGTKYYEGYKEGLLALKNKYKLNYLLHNYFPPPKEDFILNLASLNDDIYKKTLEHVESAILLSRKLEANKFGLHAGFFIDFTVKEIGKNISRTKRYNRNESIKRFCEGYKRLKEKAGDVELYIENNVFSHSNAKTFHGQSPFMLTDYNGYSELKGLIDFKLLLDVAHLKVSTQSKGLNFIEQLNELITVSDYVHLSENDGLHDQNHCFSEKSRMLNVLKNYNFDRKIVTTEIYGSISDLKLSQSIVKKLLFLDEQVGV